MQSSDAMASGNFTSGKKHFTTVVRLKPTELKRQNKFPCYRHSEWKVEPRSVFDYDPLEEGIESISLGHLRKNADQTVYEGYGKRDLIKECAPRRHMIDPKPPISWVHNGQTRWANTAKLADATSKIDYCGIKINGVALDTQALKQAQAVVACKTKQDDNTKTIPKAPIKQLSSLDEILLDSFITDYTQHGSSNSRNDKQSTNKCLEYKPSFPCINSSTQGLYSPQPYTVDEEAEQRDQPKYKDFNRSPKPFNAMYK
ncbi:uncharacterized protein LOC143464911 isoform X1 [Clavelina lepadiformis]|uniref:uncharacterized protein LOC143464911 isoform X1 n=2 Tax=Clavelina lepadiformis TaxID=159417 RepID=UPI004042EC85